jgi:hypothetical protein
LTAGKRKVLIEMLIDMLAMPNRHCLGREPRHDRACRWKLYPGSAGARIAHLPLRKSTLYRLLRCTDDDGSQIDVFNLSSLSRLCPDSVRIDDHPVGRGAPPAEVDLSGIAANAYCEAERPSRPLPLSRQCANQLKRHTNSVEIISVAFAELSVAPVTGTPPTPPAIGTLAALNCE